MYCTRASRGALTVGPWSASARLWNVDCPYCRVEMRPGWLTTRGFALGPQVVSVNWVSNYEPREGSIVLAPRGLRPPKRSATCCPECEAVVVDPKPVE
jgi:hypothetical protein